MKQYKNYENTDLLRFITIGSVDDGKSTLIGRLMYDTKSIFQDQLEAIERSSKKRGDEHLNLALLTDGLKAEREQGITIDVAYRYFSTPRRKFIMADAPGHIQYTRNMITGASTADLAIILIDARHGIIEQTKRHSYLASLLGIRHVLVAVNKMDLVRFDQSVFERIKDEYESIARRLEIPDISFVPISALNGDNVVDDSKSMPWYQGSTVLEILETVNVEADSESPTSDRIAPHGRFPVQRVIRPQSEKFPDFRGYAGRIEGGTFKVGDEISILPSNLTSRIASIHVGEKRVQAAYPGMSVVITLPDNLDISRGDMIVNADEVGIRDLAKDELDLTVSWLGDAPLIPHGSYLLRHTTRGVAATIESVNYVVDIHAFKPVLSHERGEDAVGKNDIARVRVRLSDPIFADSYRENRATGSVILIDEFTNHTVAAGMII